MSKMIICTDKNGGIGYNNAMPWHSKADFQHFKNETAGKIVVMGYNTWKSLPNKPLPGRLNIVLLSRPYENREDVDNSSSVLFMPMSSLGNILKENPEAIVIGGVRVYEAAMPYITEVIISTVSGEYKCDAHFNLDTFDFDHFRIKQTKELEDGVVVEYIEVKLRNDFLIND